MSKIYNFLLDHSFFIILSILAVLGCNQTICILWLIYFIYLEIRDAILAKKVNIVVSIKEVNLNVDGKEVFRSIGNEQ